jgi:hypothetical protein
VRQPEAGLLRLLAHADQLADVLGAVDLVGVVELCLAGLDHVVDEGADPQADLSSSGLRVKSMAMRRRLNRGERR